MQSFSTFGSFFRSTCTNRPRHFISRPFYGSSIFLFSISTKRGTSFSEFSVRQLYILGGSIMQVLVPFVWFLVAWREESANAPVAVFFTGVSLVDVSIYVRDAETKILPLLGGHHVKHDWATFLGDHDMLDWGVPLGNLFFYRWIHGSAWGDRMGSEPFIQIISARPFRGIADLPEPDSV